MVEGDVIERVAVDIHHLNYCMEKVPKDSEFYKASSPRLDQACDRLHASMECQLLEAVLGSTTDQQNNLTAENFNTTGLAYNPMLQFLLFLGNEAYNLPMEQTNDTMFFLGYYLSLTF